MIFFLCTVGCGRWWRVRGSGGVASCAYHNCNRWTRVWLLDTEYIAVFKRQTKVASLSRKRQNEEKSTTSIECGLTAKQQQKQQEKQQQQKQQNQQQHRAGKQNQRNHRQNRFTRTARRKRAKQKKKGMRSKSWTVTGRGGQTGTDVKVQVGRNKKG